MDHREDSSAAHHVLFASPPPTVLRRRASDQHVWVARPADDLMRRTNIADVGRINRNDADIISRLTRPVDIERKDWTFSNNNDG